MLWITAISQMIWIADAYVPVADEADMQSSLSQIGNPGASKETEHAGVADIRKKSKEQEPCNNGPPVTDCSSKSDDEDACNNAKLGPAPFKNCYYDDDDDPKCQTKEDACAPPPQGGGQQCEVGTGSIQKLLL